MKKLLLLIFTAFLFSALSYSQEWKEFLPKDKHESNLTFFDYQEAFKNYEQAYVAKAGFYMKDGKKQNCPATNNLSGGIGIGNQR
jgi:hypothetical protein